MRPSQLYCSGATARSAIGLTVFFASSKSFSSAAAAEVASIVRPKSTRKQRKCRSANTASRLPAPILRSAEDVIDDVGARVRRQALRRLHELRPVDGVHRRIVHRLIAAGLDHPHVEQVALL